ncbi:MULTISPECIES: hypothetical protein [Parapedobacter]|uniref:hypothetical protein n=1 Tax=Parapedobacter TaxID=416949 RepID=UPI00333F21EE
MGYFEGKKIILGAPTDYSFSDTIEKELRHQGFQVVNISYLRQGKFAYKNIFERLKSFVHKNFLGHKDYKDYLKFKRAEAWMKEKLAQVSHADYAFLIRPDQYSEEIIQMIKRKAAIMVAYQWDGLDRFPAVKSLVKYFDRFFVFDPHDLDGQHLLPITNFYTSSSVPHADPALASDACFIGTYVSGRSQQVEQLIAELTEVDLHVRYHICHGKKAHPDFKTLKTTTEKLTYQENLKRAFNADILIDINNQVHNGLSFRVFEAIGFQKKMITTSHEVKKYDFYHPNNFFVWGDHSKETLDAFLAAPFVPLPADIRKKYSFENWIRYLLDEGEYSPIYLPN